MCLLHNTMHLENILLRLTLTLISIPNNVILYIIIFFNLKSLIIINRSNKVLPMLYLFNINRVIYALLEIDLPQPITYSYSIG